MIDAHLHIDKYCADLPQALAQIREKSIQTLAVSMDVPSFRETQRISENEPLILPAFGVHPWNADQYAKDLSVLKAPLEEASIYGEIGLDFHFLRDKALYEAQRSVFELFLVTANRTGRPINVHTKGAEEAVLDSLKCRELPSVIIHWYSGPLDLVESFLDIGAYFTVGVEIARSGLIRSLANMLPVDRLLTETDGPGGWAWMKGSAGFPEQIGMVEETIAEIREMPRAELSAQIEANFREVLLAGGVDPISD